MEIVSFFQWTVSSVSVSPRLGSDPTPRVSSVQSSAGGRSVRYQLGSDWGMDSLDSSMTVVLV